MSETEKEIIVNITEPAVAHRHCVVTHCWHEDGPSVLTFPPQQPQICCWCGQRRIETLYGVRQREQHGPYTPN